MGRTASLRFYRWNLALSVRSARYLYCHRSANLLFHESPIPESANLSFFYLVDGDLSCNAVLVGSSSNEFSLLQCAWLSGSTSVSYTHLDVYKRQLVDSPVKVDFYVQDVPDVAWDLIEVADKPLTIIYSGARNLAPNLLAEDGSVGIRVTNEDFSRRLCQQFRKAIVSTSANVSGQPGAANFSEISDEIKSAVRCV